MTRSDPNRHLLEEAGYVWDERHDAWGHPKSNRFLHAPIARSLTEEQLKEWIKTGDGHTKRK